MVSGHLLFSLLAEKFVKKFSTIFQFQKFKVYKFAIFWVKTFKICTFWGEYFKNLHILGKTYVNICNMLGFYISTWYFYLSFNPILAHLVESPVIGALS